MAEARKPVKALLSSLWVACLLLLVLLYPVLLAISNASRVMLGRDQGIYQFAAWAISRGARDYLDICDINGPLTHGVHQLLLALGGSSERGFRVLDLGITSASFALVGACLPGITRTANESAPRLVERLVWAAAAWAVLSVQYLSYTYWDIGQREGFCDWLLLPSVGLQLLAQGNAGYGRNPRLVQGFTLCLAGTLSLLPWFIKPTYVLFTTAQFAILLVAPPSADRKWSASAFVAGVAVGLGLEVAWIARYSSLPAVLRAYFWEAPRMYAPIWHVGAAELFGRTGFPNWSVQALLVALLIGLLTRSHFLPLRALLLSAVPLLGVAHVLIQGKGFAYHYHPLTAGAYLGGLAVACALTERRLLVGPSWLREWATTLYAGCLLALVLFQVLSSPYLFGRSKVFEGNSFDQPRPALAWHNYYMRFSPWDLGQAARYLETATKPGSRIFLYATSPYLLYLAQRDAATCDLNVHQLNVDAAIDGRSPAQTFEPGVMLSGARSAELRAIRARNATQMFSALRRDPPAAAVFTDNEAFLSVPDAWWDFKSHNPEAASWVASHYREKVRFGTVRIWLRVP